MGAGASGYLFCSFRKGGGEDDSCKGASLHCALLLNPPPRTRTRSQNKNTHACSYYLVKNKNTQPAPGS